MLNNKLVIDVTESEIEEAFAPGILRVVPDGDAEWATKEAKLRNKARARVPWWRKLLQPAAAKRVRDAYEERWTPQAALARFTPRPENCEPVVWRDKRYFAYTVWTKRVHLLYLMRLIDILQPARVLEVGSGMGLNLCMLAARFPHVKFTGLELTAAGDEVARSFRAMDSLPEPLSQFSPLPPVDRQAHHGIELRQGSAAQMPFENGAFDLVYSIQALEQMESIRDQVFREIARVCAGHTAMFEPFAEWNEDPLRRGLILSRGFFAASVDDLRPYGLEPVFASGDMPTKFSYGIGVVVARRDQQE